MWDNIGGKIKIFAQILFGVFIVCCAVYGIALISKGSEIFGILILLLGPLFSLTSSWVLYGFGQLIQNVSEIADKQCNGAPQRQIYGIAQQAELTSTPKNNVTQSVITSQEDVRSSVDGDSRKALLKQELQQGIITQEEYDEMIKYL